MLMVTAQPRVKCKDSEESFRGPLPVCDGSPLRDLSKSLKELKIKKSENFHKLLYDLFE